MEEERGVEANRTDCTICHLCSLSQAQRLIDKGAQKHLWCPSDQQPVRRGLALRPLFLLVRSVSSCASLKVPSMWPGRSKANKHTCTSLLCAFCLCARLSRANQSRAAACNVSAAPRSINLLWSFPQVERERAGARAREFS